MSANTASKELVDTIVAMFERRELTANDATALLSGGQILVNPDPNPWIERVVYSVIMEPYQNWRELITGENYVRGNLGNYDNIIKYNNLQASEFCGTVTLHILSRYSASFNSFQAFLELFAPYEAKGFRPAVFSEMLFFHKHYPSFRRQLYFFGSKILDYCKEVYVPTKRVEDDRYMRIDMILQFILDMDCYGIAMVKIGENPNGDAEWINTKKFYQTLC